MATSIVAERTKAVGTARFDELLKTRQAHVAIIGLGYVGLPLAVAFAETGFTVTGIDINVDRIARLSRNESPVADVSANQIAGVQATGHLRLHASYDDLGRADAIIICVPTPCTKN